MLRIGPQNHLKWGLAPKPPVALAVFLGAWGQSPHYDLAADGDAAHRVSVMVSSTVSERPAAALLI